jgi:hypothetical protein
MIEMHAMTVSKNGKHIVSMIADTVISMSRLMTNQDRGTLRMTALNIP